MNPKSLCSLLLLLAVATGARAGTITNLTLSSIQNQDVTKSITLAAGQTAAVIQHFASTEVYLFFTFDNVRVSAGYISPNGGWENRKFVGPGTFEFRLNAGPSPDGHSRSITTLEIDPPAPGSVPITNIPSNAVVIPADSAGPVTILLESSADLVTWNSAMPGTYGTSTTNRFFRVRAVR